MSAVTMTEPADVAREALLEFARAADVGGLLSATTDGDGVTTVLFEATMLGYPGWRWTVSVAQLDGDEPTVLEAELLPGDGALVAPDWVPWSDRLEDWRAQQAEAGENAAEDSDEEDLDEDSDDDLDDDEDLEDSDDEDDEPDDLGDDAYDGLDPEAALEHGDADADDDADDSDEDDIYGPEDDEPASDSR